jgi:hypothetical protein
MSARKLYYEKRGAILHARAQFYYHKSMTEFIYLLADRHNLDVTFLLL